MLTPIARRSLADDAYEMLLRAIVAGELAPGQRIRDRELAEQLSVSRMPVREALKRLEDEGLVETVPNLATRVAPVRPERAAQAFPVIAALHGLAARLAVPGLAAADLAELERLDAERAAALARRDVVAAIACDDAFHDVLVRRSGNLELARALARLMPQVRRLDVLHFSALADTDFAADHAPLIDACRRGDAGEAAALTEENFLRMGRQMEAILEAADA
jgi:DNA-binding GntR family transcriptional regulator